MARAQRHRIAPAYRDAVLATGPVGYWRLGEAAGTVARDEMGLNHGTYVNSPTLGATGLLTGDPNTAMVTSASLTKYMGIADAAALDCLEGTHPWTIGVWVNYTASDWDYLFQKTGGGSSYISIRHVSTLLFVGRGDASAGDELYATPLASGTHFLIVTYTGTALTVYYDGALPATNTVASTRSLPALTSSMNFGASTAGASGIVGTIDEAAIWNRALTADEIAELYRIGMGL